MNRLFDLIAVGCVAVVVLLPKASVDARPALSGDPADVNRVAMLEDALAREPNNEANAVDLAELYLRLEHPDWALIALAPFAAKDASGRTSLVRATAHAERLEAAQALSAIKAGQSACESHPCAPLVVARLSVIGAPMQALVDEHVDPRVEPQRAKDIVGKILHATRPNVIATPPEK